MPTVAVELVKASPVPRTGSDRAVVATYARLALAEGGAPLHLRRARFVFSHGQSCFLPGVPLGPFSRWMCAGVRFMSNIASLPAQTEETSGVQKWRFAKHAGGGLTDPTRPAPSS